MLCVIGCGNSNRSDDGAGVYVAQALQAHLRHHPRAGVRVFDAGTGGMDVMFQARGATRLLLIDAARSGSEPGAIFRVPGAELEHEPQQNFTLHDFRWQHALAAGRRLFGADFPADTTVYLIEAACIDLGLELSAAVRLAAETVAQEIRQLIDSYVRPEASI
jgi:hydrogenase maturation protease